LIYAIDYAIKKWLAYSDNHVCSVQTKYAHNLPNEVLHFQWETLEKEYSENYRSVHIEMIGTACIDGQLHHSSPGADLGGVRWVRTNPLFADSFDLLVLCYSKQCSTLSAGVPVQFGYCIIFSVQFNSTCMQCNFCLGTGVPRHRDGVVRPYVRTSLANCVQYFSTS